MVRQTPISVHETSSNLETDQLGGKLEESTVLPLRVPACSHDPLYGRPLASALQPHTALLAIEMFGGCLDSFPDVGQRLVDGTFKLLASGHVVASVDKGHVAYPNEPDNGAEVRLEVIEGSHRAGRRIARSTGRHQDKHPLAVDQWLVGGRGIVRDIQKRAPHADDIVDVGFEDRGCD
jgi:hypothetical protein